MSQSRTKIFSLIVLGLLIIPALFYKPGQGQVLGVTETRSQSELSQLIPASDKPQKDQQKPSEVSTISSGVKDVKPAAIEKAVIPESIKGKVIYDSSQKVAVATNKFSLGSSINIFLNGRKIELVVNQIRQDLPADVILIVDEATYQKLGGKPGEQDSITIEASRTN